MAAEAEPSVIPVSAKLPAAVVAELDRLAASRNQSRSALLREAAEAAIEGRMDFLTDEDREARSWQAQRAEKRAAIQATRDALGISRR